MLHAVDEVGIPARDIAEAIGKALNLSVASVPTDLTAQHFGWMGMFFGANVPASSVLTRELLGWEPTQPKLLADIAAGHYPGA